MQTGLAAALVGALGCVTPYQPIGYSGGYADRRLDNGDYIITVKVNGYTDRATALEFLHRRAGELCPGGFDIIDRTGGDNGGLVATGHFSHKPEEDAVVRCKATTPPVVAVEAPRTTIVGTHPLFCAASSKDQDGGSCFSDEDDCIAQGAGAPCIQSGFGACFNATVVTSKARITICSPSIADCDKRLSTTHSNSDYWVTAEQCGIYRFKQPAVSPTPAPSPSPASSDVER